MSLPFYSVGGHVLALKIAVIAQLVAFAVNTTITAIRELGAPLSELVREHLGKERRGRSTHPKSCRSDGR
ncbi:hypothetical protein [Amycolatopsis saalfeldensis]|uniref:Uncharacterized protein n=1 Tax=Amycolatopsis saalfeldensis TaxID=394193 RepID=A0A1H8X1B2_9PSEU|nr:hypothetical protein [Amycolatopsis saalfeldensis]SEP33649.1 hypothetical protein SAMN04489732_106151 [Amycolatopsis saalfeldensis]